MSNEFYTHTGWPATSGSGQSVDARAELNALQAAFDKMPALSTNANKLVVVNGSGNGLTIMSQANVSSTTWTPTFNVAVPGDFAKTYSTQVGRRISLGGLTMLTFDIQFSAFTYTTAGGSVWIGGMPVDCVHTPDPIGSVQFQGFTKAGYGSLVTNWSGFGVLSIMASGSGVASVNAAITDFPSGGTPFLKGTIVFG